MAKFKSDFLHTLDERGFLHQLTDAEGLDARLRKGGLAAYIGFDCTAPSLHVGSLLQIMLLRHLQQSGGKPIVLMGGGTTMVGDPSGKDETRQLLTREKIAGHTASIQASFDRFLNFGDGPSDAIMVDNTQWLDELDYIPFLREIGRHFTINKMLGFESVKRRLEREQPLTFLEFNYMIIQAYDFVELNRKYGCELQMGGSDQWGNIVNGIDLARRLEGNEVFGLTSPLITTADGAKMGKTAEGAVWLNESELSSYDYWQFWRNTADDDVGRFLRLFTDLDLPEIAKLEALQGSEINEAKKILANEATRLCRGHEAQRLALETAQNTFEAGLIDENLPSLEIRSSEISGGNSIGILELFVRAGLAKSNKEARRLIEQGGARLNDAPISDPDLVLGPSALPAGSRSKLSAGKKRHAVIRVTEET